MAFLSLGCGVLGAALFLIFGIFFMTELVLLVISFFCPPIQSSTLLVFEEISNVGTRLSTFAICLCKLFVCEISSAESWITKTGIKLMRGV